jgi:hypothetical protein
MHIELVNYLEGMVISTIEIANSVTLRGNIYESSWEVTDCALIFAFDREWKCVFAMYI